MMEILSRVCGILIAVVIAACGASSQPMSPLFRLVQERIGANAASEFLISGLPSGVATPQSVEIVRSYPALAGGTVFEMRCVPIESCGRFVVTTASLTPTLTAVPVRRERKRVLQRRGDRVQLEVVASAYKGTIPVRCMASGDIGDWILVRTLDGKRSFTAQIVSAGVVSAGQGDRH
jgi:hypothetical protein